MSDPDIETTNVGDFLDLIYKQTQGHAYVACKVPGSQHQFTKHFFEWPNQRDEMIAFLLSRRAMYEVYYAPALFNNPTGQKKDVLGSNVVWVEFDGNAPESIQGIPEPSIRVSSSSENHEHWYWVLSEFTGPYDLERINRGLTYFLNADSSGWDANQILRPVSTFNHKRQKEVTLLEKTLVSVSLKAFEGLPDPPAPAEAPVPESIPQVEDVIALYTFPKPAWELFKGGVPEGKRSEGLMSLGYYLAEMGLPDDAMFSVLLNADERWGKFSGRQDQAVRLMEIVVRARLKYPVKGKQSEVTENALVSLGFKTILATEVNLEWVWEDFLQESGYLLLTGHSGVGKTQFALDAGARFALGQDFLGKAVKGEHKIGFFSLEMGLPDLKYFLSQQAKAYSDEEKEILEKNFRFYPLGEPIYLNRDKEKRRIEETIEREELTGFFVDSLGSTTEEELTAEKDVKNLMDWNDHIRQQFNVFSLFIHHHRKATGDNKKPNKLADVYGSQYITARATTVMCMWEVSGAINAIDLSTLKLRLAQKPKPFTVFRGLDLKFHLQTGKQAEQQKEAEALKEPVENGEAPVFNFKQPGKGIGGI